MARRFQRFGESTGESTGEINISPLIDVVFILLIFFIVTSSFLLRQGLFLSLPSKSAGASKVETSQLLKITPTQEGFKLDEFDFTREEMLKELAERKAKANEDEELVALIFMNKEVRYDRLVDALSLVRESKIRKVSVRSIDGKKGPGGKK